MRDDKKGVRDDNCFSGLDSCFRRNDIKNNLNTTPRVVFRWYLGYFLDLFTSRGKTTRALYILFAREGCTINL